MRRRRVIACAVVAAWSCAGSASAQPAPRRAPDAAASAEAGKKDEAREHFQQGLALFDEESWDAALAEFMRARALYPSRSATKNAALCLRLLKRYDEALDAFEELLAIPNLTGEDRELAERESVALRRLVGAVVIVDAEPGATIIIDGRDRGKTPTAPLRVSVGTHSARIFKEGFEPYESRIDVAGGQSVLVSPQLARRGAPRVASAGPPVSPRDLLTPAVITLGLGGVAIGVGAVLGELTLSETSAIRARCVGDVCPTSQLPAARGAGATAAGSTVGFVVGGALAATGLTLLVLRSRTRAAAPALAIGPGFVLAHGTF